MNKQLGYSLTGLLISVLMAGVGFTGAMRLYAEMLSFSTDSAVVQSHDKQLLQSLMALEIELMNAGYGIDDADESHLVVDDGRLLWRYIDSSDWICDGLAYEDGQLSYLAASDCDDATALPDMAWSSTEIMANFPEGKDKPLPEISFVIDSESCSPFGLGPKATYRTVTISAETAAIAAGNAHLAPLSSKVCIVNIAG